MSVAWVAVGATALGAVANYAGASDQADAATNAANTQANSQAQAAALQQQNLNATTARFAPYLAQGNNAIGPLQAAMGYNADGSVNRNSILQQQFNPGAQFSAPTAAEAQATPGYQFTLNQGLKSTQNGAAARGLGTSGAAMKGAANYATGLADSTYNDVYSRALNTFNTNYNANKSTFATNYGQASDNANRLQGLVSNGQNAAGNLGSLSAASTNSIGNALTSAGNAQATGMVGAATANASGLNGIGNALTTYAGMQNNAGYTGANALQTGIANMSSDPIGSLNSQKGWT
jgi:hypothetical protein